MNTKTVAQTDRAEGAKERVLAAWPDAEIRGAGHGKVAIFSIACHDAEGGEEAWSRGLLSAWFGYGSREHRRECAWFDAASKLPLPNQKEACKRCNGSGRPQDQNEEYCFRCDGSGIVLPDQKREGEGAIESADSVLRYVHVTLGRGNFDISSADETSCLMWVEMSRRVKEYCASLAPGIRDGGRDCKATVGFGAPEGHRVDIYGNCSLCGQRIVPAPSATSVPHHFTDEQILASCSGEATKQAIYHHLHRMTSEEKDALYGAVGKLAGVEGRGPAPISELTFGEFQSMNMERCRRAFPMCDDWTMKDWAVALSGEVGELCNLLKKDRRGLATDEPYDLDGPYKEQAEYRVLSELADIITYADLMISLLSADTAEVVLEKFNEVSKRVNYLTQEPK